MTKKLSAPQLYFLHYAGEAGGHECPFVGSPRYVAWNRTANALESRGLVMVVRGDDGKQVAFNTPAGDRALFDATEGED